METEGTQPQKFIENYPKLKVIFNEGTPGEEMYIIYSGKVGLYTQRASGQKELLATLEAGDFFGEMALVDDSPRSATAIAEEDKSSLGQSNRIRVSSLNVRIPITAKDEKCGCCQVGVIKLCEKRYSRMK